jgi:hypothetical protein
MIDVGMKAGTPGEEFLVDLTLPRGGRPAVMFRSSRPTALPSLPEGHRLFGSLDQGLGERLYLIESLADAQDLWDKQDYALAAPVWYSAPAMFVTDN